MAKNGKRKGKGKSKFPTSSVKKIVKAIKADKTTRSAGQIISKIKKGKNKKSNNLLGLLRYAPMVGGLFGPEGAAVGKFISTIAGQGDYLVGGKPMMNSLMQNGPPQFGTLTKGFRVRHREYIQDIISTVGFDRTVFQINPGLPQLFPWLSTLAPNFETYKIHGMVVYLNTTSATAVASTNTALGIWGAVTQYDPTEPPFANKQECEQYVGAVSAVPCKSIMHPIECKPKTEVLDQMYIRQGAIEDGEDLKFYDWGQVQIFTQGAQAASTIGEMWISYDIEFFKPRLPTGGTNQIGTDTIVVTGTMNGGQPFSLDTVDPQPGSTVGTYVSGGSDAIIFDKTVVRPGYYLVDCKWVGNATASAIAPVLSVTGPYLSAEGYFNNFSSSTTKTPGSGVTTTQVGCSIVVNYSAGGTDTVVADTSGTIPTSAVLTITVSRLSPGIFLSLAKRVEKDKMKASGYISGLEPLYREYLCFKKFMKDREDKARDEFDKLSDISADNSRTELLPQSKKIRK